MRLFKYVTSETAKTVLSTKKLRWSSPSRFNDPFDVQFDLHIDEFDERRIAAMVMEELWSVYSGRQALNPDTQLGRMFARFLSNSGLSRAALFETKGLYEAIVAGIGNLKALVPDFQTFQRSVFKDTKLLCLSEACDNILMWSHYSGEHTGVVMAFAPPSQHESVFTLAKPVSYSKAMPRLMETDDVIRFFCGQWKMDGEAIMRSSIFVKAIDWSYEKEWRIWLPNTDAAVQFVDMPFDSVELESIYLGCRTSQADQDALTKILEEHFSHCSIYAGHKSDRVFALRFERVK